MRAMRLGVGVGALMSLLGAASDPSQAQAARRGPPIIRIYSATGVNYVGTTSYITPRISLSENAYVFAVEMDMDGRIQVLHPDFPGISVRIAAQRPLQLPNFFAGFNSSRYGYATFAGLDYSYSNYGFDDTRGTIIALASRAPFNLERIESGGDWDITTIRRLIERRSPLSAAAELARYLGQQGEPIGRDFLRFDGRNSYPYGSAYSSYSSCALFYGYGYVPSLVFRQLQALALYNQLRASGGGLRIVGYDVCGTPIYSARFAGGGQQAPIGHFPRPPARGDTTVFPKSRLPQPPVPRGASGYTSEQSEDIPRSRRGGLPQMGEDVTIKAAPTGRRGEPRQIFQDYGGGMTIPQGRMPIERVIVPRGEASASGVQGAPAYRSDPRSGSPPPRAPERPRESEPPRAVPDRPPAASPSSPRTGAPITREPASVPPPRGR